MNHDPEPIYGTTILAVRRWRRQQVAESLRTEITPKNILMIGPTGVGKTEIARRLARLAKAPFIKVEATKFTEVGYVCREVDSIVRDRVEISVKMTREEEIAKVRHRAADSAEERVLDALLPCAQAGFTGDAAPRDNDTRQRFRKMLRDLLETVSFDAADRSGTHVLINRDYVEDNLGELVKDQDLSRYIL